MSPGREERERRRGGGGGGGGGGEGGRGGGGGGGGGGGEKDIGERDATAQPFGAQGIVAAARYLPESATPSRSRHTPLTEASDSPDYGAASLDREDLKTATLSGARWVGVSRIVAELLALATTVVLARLMSPAEYGIAVVVLILPMLASILTFEGFGAFLVLDPDLHPRAGRLGGAALDHERLVADDHRVLPLPARGRAGLRSRDEPTWPSSARRSF